MLEKLMNDLYDGAVALLAALAPGAFGSAVAVAHRWDEELTWPRRLTQWVIGIVVSYYVNLGLSAYFGFGAFAAQSTGFVLGMIALKAVPPFIDNMARLAGEVPSYIREKLTGTKGDSQ